MQIYNLHSLINDHLGLLQTRQKIKNLTALLDTLIELKKQREQSQYELINPSKP